MRRGDVAAVALSGDFGKSRPALVIQSDQFDGTSSITVLLISSTSVDAPLIRLTVQPTEQNGLRKPSQIMIDKAMTVKRDRFGKTIGHVDDETMISVNRSLALFFGIA
jgi:mRNA interferase MazF